MEHQGQPLTPRRVRINMADLVDAFEMSGDMLDQYLDLETGEIIPITSDIRHEMREIYDEIPGHLEGDALRGAVVEAIENRGVPEWMDDQLVDAIRVEGALGTRFIELPLPDPRNGYQDMELFIETVESPAFQERLSSAIHGRGAFGRFKDTLLDEPSERQRWFAFKDDRVRERAREWLADEGIEPIGEAER
jgi:hypothetical protein